MATFPVHNSDAHKYIKYKKKTKILPYNLAYDTHALVLKTVIHRAPLSFIHSSFSHFVYMNHFHMHLQGPPVTVTNDTEVFLTLLGPATDAFSHLSW